LLGQLNLKLNKFYDTSSEPQENNLQNEIRVGSFCGLVGIAFGGKQTFFPICGDTGLINQFIYFRVFITYKIRATLDSRT
jgi:hypothetical protein